MIIVGGCTANSLKQSIVTLLNNCQKLTHLSLTGVQAFLRDDLEQFCRTAPPGMYLILCFYLSELTSDRRIH